MRDEAYDASASRRRFLRQTALLGAPMLLLRGLTPGALAFAATPAWASGNFIDVKAKGAVGDGQRDDTASIQSAIDALPADGGTVHVPAGTYVIDSDHPLRLRDKMHLELAHDAVLTAKPTDKKRYYIVLLDQVSDVEISGGHIMGERDHHLGESGEWGYGIFVRGASRVRIHDIKVSKCWGDGICIGGVASKGAATKYSTDIILSKVVCTGNRRQGLTIGPARQVRVVDSEFSDTAGTRPACGIDMEPDEPDTAEDIQITNCLLRGNQGCGIQVYRNVSQVTLKGCTVQGNGAYGVLMSGARGSVLTQSTISGNGMTGVVLRGGANDCQVAGNTFANNATKTIKHLLDNVRQASVKSASGNTRDVQVKGDTQSITVSGNTFSG